MDETTIEFKSALWLKIFIPFGILLFFSCGIGMLIFCYETILIEKYFYSIVFIGLSFLMFYLCNMGFILFRFRNLRIIISNEKIRLINNGQFMEYRWSDGLKVKDRSGFKVFEMFDSNGKRLFMIDYEFPKFSLLTTIINKKILYPNKSLEELMQLNND